MSLARYIWTRDLWHAHTLDDLSDTEQTTPKEGGSKSQPKENLRLLNRFFRLFFVEP